MNTHIEANGELVSNPPLGRLDERCIAKRNKGQLSIRNLRDLPYIEFSSLDSHFHDTYFSYFIW